MLIKDFTVLRDLISPWRMSNLFFFRPLDGFSLDSRAMRPGQGFVAVKGQLCDGHDFIAQAVRRGASCVISQRYIKLNPRVPLFVVQDSYRALAQIAGFIRRQRNPYVYAVTGSVGKTTTKDMLAFLLRDECLLLKSPKTENNILGVAKAMFALQDEDTAVLELGTNHPGEIAALADIVRPDVGIITFIKPSHLEGFKTLRGVFKEKVSLLNANSRMKVVLNADDPYLSRVRSGKNIFWFGTNKRNDIYAKFIEHRGNTSVFLVQDKYRLILATPFDDLIYNALAAILAASLRGIAVKDLVAKMNAFIDFSALRMQINDSGRFRIINDAYNSNPYSFSQAVKVARRFARPRIAVVGDMLELGAKTEYYHRLMAKDIINADFDYCLTLGTYTRYLGRQLKASGYHNVFHFSRHKDIADFINKKVVDKSLVFLKGSRRMALEKVVEALERAG